MSKYDINNMPVIAQTEVEQETELVFAKAKAIGPLRIRGTDGYDVILMTWSDYLDCFGELFEAESIAAFQKEDGDK